METIKIKSSKKQLLGWYWSIILFFALFSCDDFLEVDLPTSQLNTPFVFENYATANAAMVDIYAKIRDNGIISGNNMGMGASLGAYTDELDFFGQPTLSLNFFFSNTVLPTTATIETWWNNSFNNIYAANTIYESVEDSETLTQDNKNQLKGESLFIRALIHFHLVNLFGDIPYITSTDYRQNQSVARLSKQEIYNFIILDLENAKSLLPDNYFGGTRVRPNKSVASALLSRVYLYNQNWAEAANEASFIINQSEMYSFPASLNNTFLIQSQSTIWQLLPQASNRNTLEGATFIFLTAPPPSLALSEELLSAFELGDQRKLNWTKQVTNSNGTWYHAFKYKQRTNTSSSQEYSIIFRLAEQYLIRAEARARQGETITAMEDLNIIRTKAGLPASTANTQTDILQAIMQERKVELFTEFGHRFFDLKRLDKLDAELNLTKPGWSTYMKNLPIPQRELLLNPNLLPQNNGY
jgi:starch-binding outer membrane protein, SusD/RagB family